MVNSLPIDLSFSADTVPAGRGDLDDNRYRTNGRNSATRPRAEKKMSNKRFDKGFILRRCLGFQITNVRAVGGETAGGFP